MVVVMVVVVVMMMLMMMVHAGVVSQKDRYDDEREAMCEVCNKPLRTTPQTPKINTTNPF